MCIYPENLKGKPKLWLWQLRDISIIGICLILSALALAQSLCTEEPVLRVCKNCGKIYYNPHARSEFCSVRCRNQYNVRAWRSRQRENV